MTQGKLFIGGRWVPAASSETLPVLCPSTGESFAEIARGGAADIDAAVRAAEAALEGPWGRMSAVERGRLLQKLGQKILDHFDEMAELESRDTGKPLSQGRADIQAVARYFEFYGTAADKLHGHVIPFMDGYSASVVHEPHGVTGHIVPWNYPMQIFGRSVAAALAMGNCSVVKPAEDASMTALRVAAFAAEVGFPEGVLNIVTGLGTEAGAALAAHPGVAFISFTGSPEVGRLVQQAAAEHWAPCVLELGGKSPQIVFADADFDKALPVMVKAITQNAGQTCSAGSRLLIEQKAYDDFVPRLAEAFSQVKVGAHDMDLDCGALINAKQQRRVESFLQVAREEGIPVLAEGRLAPNLPTGGFYVLPTLFGPVPRSNRLACDEVFGPVLSVLPFADEADAIRLANATDYGLVASVWSRDGDRQQRVARKVRSGQVYINCYGAGGGIELPFGGVKKSGHGREKGFDALYEMAVTKTIVHRFA